MVYHSRQTSRYVKPLFINLLKTPAGCGFLQNAGRRDRQVNIQPFTTFSHTSEPQSHCCVSRAARERDAFAFGCFIYHQRLRRLHHQRLCKTCSNIQQHQRLLMNILWLKANRKRTGGIITPSWELG